MSNLNEESKKEITKKINEVSDSKIGYEQAIANLEQILAELENNELPLEQSIAKFEEGIKLVKHCQSILSETEQKVRGLMVDKLDDL